MSLREEKDGGGGRGRITTTTYNELITLANSNNISNWIQGLKSPNEDQSHP